MITDNPNQFAASAEFTDAVISKLATSRGIHAETAISAMARMAGTLLLRSSGLPLANFAPRTSIFSDVMDQLGQQLIRVVDQGLAAMQVPFDVSKIDYDLGHEHTPKMGLMETQQLLDLRFRSILDHYGLTEAEGAYAAAISTAVLIENCADFLDPHVAYVIAVYGMVEASKTVPFDGVAGQVTADVD